MFSTVLDLTDANTIARLGTTQKELSKSWQWQMAARVQVPTQELGQAAFKSELFQAIRFASTKQVGNCNLVIFTERLLPPAFIRCTDPKFPHKIP